MKIDDLIPGMVIVDRLEGHKHTFVGKVDRHPLYPQLRMVIWRRDNGEWFHDALSGMMDVSIVGDIESADPSILEANLRRSLLDPSRGRPIITNSPTPKKGFSQPKRGHWG